MGENEGRCGWRKREGYRTHHGVIRVGLVDDFVYVHSLSGVAMRCQI
jgi:hypothetical protein